MSRIFFLFLFLLISVQVALSNTLNQDDFIYEAYVYDETEKMYMPNVLMDWSEVENVGFYFEEESLDAIYFNLPASTGVFVNNKIVHFSKTQEFYNLKVGKWQNEYPIFISLQNEKGLEFLEVSKKRIAPQLSEKSATLDSMSHEKKSFKDFYILASIIILAFFAVLGSTLKSNFLSTVSVKKNQNNKPILSPVLMIMFCFSMVVGLVFMPIHSDFFNNTLDNPTWSHFYAWLIVSILVFSLLVLKYIILSKFSLIFNLKDLNNIHFSNFLNIGTIAFGLIFMMLALYFFKNGHFFWTNSSLNYFISISVYLIFILTLYKKISEHRGVNKFHLIFYLCASELIPMLLTVKWFISF